MDKNVSKEVKRIIICCIASCIIAVNIRTFVRTGGLFPGGANGLTLLIQSIFDRYLHITIPYTASQTMLIYHLNTGIPYCELFDLKSMTATQTRNAFLLQGLCKAKTTILFY